MANITQNQPQSPEEENLMVSSQDPTAEQPLPDTAPPKKKSRKKLIIILCSAGAAIVIAAVVLILILSRGQGSEDFFDDYEYIDTQVSNYYNGIVEPQQTSDVVKDPERSIGEVYVKVGDIVKKGDKLFSYDTEETANKLSKAQIEYESIENEIAEYTNRIAQLTRQRNEAGEDQQLDYTVQIQEQENMKSQSELSLKIKQVELDNLRKSLDNSVVTSPIDGVVKQINDSNSDSSSAFMKILMSGSYRVKGTVDEMNVRVLTEGMDVTVHSRFDQGLTWKGTISKIDTETTVSDSNSNDSYYGGSNADSATKYYFYVSLESSDGILLGEHVYVEPMLEEELYDEAYDEEFPGEDAAPDADPQE